jgi:hypothetical protein
LLWKLAILILTAFEEVFFVGLIFELRGLNGLLATNDQPLLLWQNFTFFLQLLQNLEKIYFHCKFNECFFGKICQIAKNSQEKQPQS